MLLQKDQWEISKFFKKLTIETTVIFSSIGIRAFDPSIDDKWDVKLLSWYVHEEPVITVSFLTPTTGYDIGHFEFKVTGPKQKDVINWHITKPHLENITLRVPMNFDPILPTMTITLVSFIHITPQHPVMFLNGLNLLYQPSRFETIKRWLREEKKKQRPYLTINL